MAIDWDSLLGDTAAGALSGSAAGPWGAVAGGVTGLVGGILGGGKKTPQFSDPYTWQRDYASRQLLGSDIGAKGAAAQAGQELNFARDQAEQASNNPMLAGNASAQAGIRNKLLRGAEHGAQSAYLQGAEIDSNNKAKGAQIAGQSSQLAQSQFELNQAYKDRPTFGQQFLQQGASILAGYGLSKIFGDGAPADTPQVTPKASSLTFPEHEDMGDINLRAPKASFVGGSIPSAQAPSAQPQSFGGQSSAGDTFSKYYQRGYGYDFGGDDSSFTNFNPFIR